MTNKDHFKEKKKDTRFSKPFDASNFPCLQADVLKERMSVSPCH